jgi:tRNA acetyltransferase TAN1
LLQDFNLLASTTRGYERQMCHELDFLLKEAGDIEAKVDRSGIRGLIVAKTTLNPIEVIKKFREILDARPFEFRYALRIIPIEKVVITELDKIKNTSLELASKICEKETFRVTVEKRFTNIHSHDLIEAIATDVSNKVELEKPDKIILIEILGGLTGISVLESNDILSVLKAKML